MSSAAAPRKTARITHHSRGDSYFVEGASQLAGDGFRQYLREIGSIPLLSLPEERQLGERIRTARDAGWLDRAARDALVERNLRLVVAVAKGFVGQGLSLDDLTQEGSIGLIHAAEIYDERRAHFSTLAVWWIRQAISRAVANYGRVIRRPVHVLELMQRVKRAAQRFEQDNARAATLDELADASGLKLERLIEILIAPAEPLSLDVEQDQSNHPVGARHDDTTLGAFIADASAEEAFELADIEIDSGESVDWALDFLDVRERTILELRLGLDDSKGISLEAVGRVLGITRERVRQIESRALRKLRVRFKLVDDSLVRRTPDEEIEQERWERKRVAAHGKYYAGALSIGNVKNGKRSVTASEKIAALIDNHTELAS